ncbi:ovarian-specific serine/threonine-protein kinase lok-related [Anaeramoeba ignava]|uniref:Ovarian-specific serine/threonine-protein kinase lok-related n=1 Tax=Anaeramoeba ignava TaxID=1746090 RepID=A0A9Q0LHW7_ANAIG|nr:ovarian-specific serine/threonine-protein kinase lok-related [Anaeramoeba ignava]
MSDSSEDEDWSDCEVDSDEETESIKFEQSNKKEEDNQNLKQVASIPWNPNPEAWGAFVSLVPKFPHVDLIGKVTFGRNSTCNHVINDERVSGFHCSVYRDINEKSDSPNPFYIKIIDNSSNGTYVNGTRLVKNEEKILFHADKISFIYSDINHTEPNPCYRFEDFYVLPPTHHCSDIEETYIIGETLGEGQFAQVKLVKDKETGIEYAMKIIDRSKYISLNNSIEANSSKIMNEVKVLKHIKHPNIVCVKDVYKNSVNLFLILELCQGGDLGQQIKQFGNYDETNSKIIFQQIMSAISYIHDKNIAHRDMKPENILLISQDNTTSIKLTDFGYSRFVSEVENKMYTYAGTVHYLAPEVIQDAQRGGYSKSCDIWSCGVILYYLLSGDLPFRDQNDEHMPTTTRIVKGKYTFGKKFNNISPAAKNLIRRCLTINPSHRITAKQALKHPWLTGESEKITDEFENVWIDRRTQRFNQISQKRNQNHNRFQLQNSRFKEQK